MNKTRSKSVVAFVVAMKKKIVLEKRKKIRGVH
jgi:hypothetical protein